jgi:hypothetical protein
MSEFDELVRDVMTFLKTEKSEGETHTFAETIPLFVPEAPPVVHKAAPVSVTPKPRPPAPPPQKQPAPPLKEVGFELAPIEKVKAAPSAPSGMRDVLARLAPGLKLSAEPLDDARARQIGAGWKVRAENLVVAVISFGEKGGDLEFLKNLSQAISTHLAQCQLIDGEEMEKGKRWPFFLESPNLKWIVAPRCDISKWPEYAQILRHLPASNESFLGKIPLLHLTAPTEYQKNPALKKSLWATLCQTLKS